MILPTIITSPAIVTWNGKSYYSRAGIRSQVRRETFNVESDSEGKIDERHKSLTTEISFQPDGQIIGAGLAKYFPYGVSSVGKSIFTGLTGSVLPLVIQTKFGGASNTGQTITFPRAALTKQPQLRLKPTDTLFGDMTLLCVGDPTVQSSNAASWQTIADAAFSDTTFDESKIVSDIYQAAYGSSPYAAMGSQSGFEVDLGIETDTIMADDFGVADMTLKSITATARFTPDSLTEAQVGTLMGAQGAAVVYPGQSLSKSNTDLVVSGSGNNGLTLTVTVYKAGVKQGGYMYASGKHRFDALEFTSKRTWTAGSANPLWAIVIS